MFFILSKLLGTLTKPLVIVLILFLLSRFLKKQKIKRFCLKAAFILLLLFTNDFIVNEIFLLWERPPVPFYEFNKKFDVAVILTGVTNTEAPLRDRAFFNKGADRVIHPFYLYKQGKIEKFLISGGTGKITGNPTPEALILSEALALFGVPENNIIIESKSKNTYQNAIYSAEIIRKEFNHPNILLVTSAFHMIRSKTCFNKAGLEVTTLNTDYYSHKRKFTPDVLIIPNLDALIKWEKLFKELAGLLAYKIMGYI